MNDDNLKRLLYKYVGDSSGNYTVKEVIEAITEIMGFSLKELKDEIEWMLNNDLSEVDE